MTDAPQSPDFVAVQALIALVAHPKACEARVQTLQRETDACAAAQSKLAGERTAHDQRAAELDARSATLDEREKKLRRREAELHGREQQAKEAAAIRAAKVHDRGSDGFMAGSGLSRELS
jgi:hypothetical protein